MGTLRRWFAPAHLIAALGVFALLVSAINILMTVPFLNRARAATGIATGYEVRPPKRRQRRDHYAPIVRFYRISRAGNGLHGLVERAVMALRDLPNRCRSL